MSVLSIDQRPVNAEDQELTYQLALGSSDILAHLGNKGWHQPLGFQKDSLRGSHRSTPLLESLGG